jgi:hypothetical protein
MLFAWLAYFAVQLNCGFKNQFRLNRSKKLPSSRLIKPAAAISDAVGLSFGVGSENRAAKRAENRVAQGICLETTT